MDKNDSFLIKIRIFLQKVNPYAEPRIDEFNGKLLDSRGVRVYREFAQWVLDCVVNGFFINFVLFVFLIQPLNPLIALANGVSLWLTGKVIHLLWEGYVEGQIRIKRG